MPGSVLYPRDAGAQRTDGIPDLLNSHLLSVMVTADTPSILCAGHSAKPVMWIMASLNRNKYPLRQSLANYGSQAKSGPLPVFVDKALLEHSHAHLLTRYP